MLNRGQLNFQRVQWETVRRRSGAHHGLGLMRLDFDRDFMFVVFFEGESEWHESANPASRPGGVYARLGRSSFGPARPGIKKGPARPGPARNFDWLGGPGNPEWAGRATLR